MKRILSFMSGIALIVVSLSGCNKEPETPAIVLSAPVVTATVDGTSVSLKWQAVTNATSYKVEYKESSAAEYSVAGTPTYSPFSVTGLEFGHSYEFRVKALAKDVESEYSQVVSVTLEKTFTPPVVTTSFGISYIDVKWEVVENATSYQVEHKPSMESSWTTDYTGNGEDTEFSYKISGLSGGVTYDVRVAALGEGYTTTYSEVATVTTTAEPSTMISTGAQLATWLSNVSIDTRDVAALACDIDMSGITITSAPSFGGTLEGQGFAIKNLVSSVPMFQTNNGVINNLVIDESCSFTVPEGTKIFGTLVATDQGGTYTLVKNKANVTYTATANVSTYLIIGGLLGVAKECTMTDCSNSGAISIQAAGFSHRAVGMGGLVGYTEQSSFTNCVNRGPISIVADYGDPNTKFDASVIAKNPADVGVNVGGIVGLAFDFDTKVGDKTAYCSFINCENQAEGVITVTHTRYEGLPSDSSSRFVSVGGLVGRGRGNMKSSKNWAPVRVTGITSDRTGVKLQNCVYLIGGLTGAARWAMCFESCTNNGEITFDYDGIFSSTPRNMSFIGGICGWQDYDPADVDEEGNADIYAYYCKQKANITVTGHGISSVGGIFGYDGKQIGNEVASGCKISYTGFQGYVGGLVGFVDKSQDAYVIKKSSCEAEIVAENCDGEDNAYLGVGGLMGCWGGATGSCLLQREDVPCSFSGSVTSASCLTSVGIVVGRLDGDNKAIRFGDSENPIRVSGTFGKQDLAPTTITTDLLTEFAIGKKPKGDAWSIYVVCAQ